MFQQQPQKRDAIVIRNTGGSDHQRAKKTASVGTVGVNTVFPMLSTNQMYFYLHYFLPYNDEISVL